AWLRKRQPSASPPARRRSSKSGTMKELRAPSPRTRRTRFGSMKATKKTSENREPPSLAARTASRMRPVIRERRVMAPTSPAAFRIVRFSLIADTLARAGMNGKRGEKGVGGGQDAEGGS